MVQNHYSDAGATIHCTRKIESLRSVTHIKMYYAVSTVFAFSMIEWPRPINSFSKRKEDLGRVKKPFYQSEHVEHERSNIKIEKVLKNKISHLMRSRYQSKREELKEQFTELNDEGNRTRNKSSKYKNKAENKTLHMRKFLGAVARLHMSSFLS